LKYRKVAAERSKTNNDINKCLKVRTPASILLTVPTSGIKSDFASLSFADEFFDVLFPWKRKIGATIRTFLCPYFSSVITFIYISEMIKYYYIYSFSIYHI